MTESITVEELSKRYELGALQQETQLRDQLVRLLRAPFRKRAPKEILWALRGVSFKVDEGEVVGIVAPEEPDLLGLVSHLAPVLVSGNSAVVSPAISSVVPFPETHSPSNLRLTKYMSTLDRNAVSIGTGHGAAA